MEMVRVVFFFVANFFRLYQLEFELVEIQNRAASSKYWLNLNRNRFNDNRDAKSNKKRK